MKISFIVYIICVSLICFIGGWMFSKYSKTSSNIVSTGWEGKWVMDSEEDKGLIHSVLQLSSVTSEGFDYNLSYTYDGSTGGDDSSNFHGDVQVLKNKITQTWYLDDGSKNVVRVLTLAKDGQSISLNEDTCPGIFNISPTPDGCEIPSYSGTYHRLK